VTCFGDVITIKSQLSFFKVRFRHNQFKTQFIQTTQLQITKIEDLGALGAESNLRLAIFENLLLK